MRRPIFPAFLISALALAASARAQSLNLGDQLARWGYGRDSAKAEDIGRWSLKTFSVQAERNRGYVELGGVKIYLGSAIAEDNGRLYVQKRDFDKTISPILAPSTTGVPRLRTIVLDPGHGGKDPGNMNKNAGLFEKNLTVDVVRRLKFILESAGYKVLVTRTRDAFVERDDRPAYANRAKADLFVSIHFNGSTSSSAQGIETYCLSPAGQFSTNDPKHNGDTSAQAGNRNDNWNVLAAYYIQKTLVDKLDAEDRGVRRARFKVICDIECPGVLVECGFLNNPHEAALIATATHREKLAQGVADAIALYHARITRLAQKTAAKK